MPTEQPPAPPPPAPAPGPAPPPAEAPPAAREGHRPLLTPAQAAFLARALYGIRCKCSDGGTSAVTADVGAGGAASGGATGGGGAMELPSYDDRNFLITGRRQRRPQRKQCGPGDASQAPSSAPPSQAPSPSPAPLHPEATGRGGGCVKEDATEGAVAGVVADEEAEEVVEVVLKVHNTQDSGRTAQLQAIDEAMRRLRSAGVLTNTPLRPAGDNSGVGGVGGESDGCGVCGGGGGGSMEVPYRTTATAAVTAPETETEALLCWAHLPCTCHPPPDGPWTVGTAAPAAEASSPAPAGAAAATVTESTPASEAEAASSDGGDAGAGARAGERHSGGKRHWHIVRCLSYVPGRMLASVPYLTPALLLSLGRLMGRVSAGLAGWHPAALRGCGHHWHPENGAAVVRRLVPTIPAFDQERRALLLAVADELAAAAPRLADPALLPRQVCHADANCDNCVVSDDGKEVVGLIDFGDMASMPRVCEVSITMLYAILLGLNRPMGPLAPAPTPQKGAVSAGTDLHAAQEHTEAGNQEKEEEEEEYAGATLRRLLSVAGLVLCGFQRLVRLRAEELAVVPLLLRGRLAQSLALGAASVVSDPGNAEYLLATQRPGWRVIRLLTHGSVMTDEEMVQHMLRVQAELGPEAQP